MMRIRLLVLLNFVTLINCHGGGGDEDKGGRPMTAMVTYDSQALKLNDTKWTAGRQWYMTAGSYSHNVLPAWSNCLRGSKDVTVAVVGDGLYYQSPELKPNYNAAASFNLVDGNDDPKPALNSASMGTKAASLIAAATNEKCGVGIAFNTSIAGLRYDVTDAQKFDENLSAALLKKLDKVDILVGVAAKGTGKMGQKIDTALQDLVTKGRSGKGSIFFWPTGDGQTNGTCSWDSLVNDIRTISLGAINKKGKALLTSQKCGAVMASAYSEDEGSTDPMIAVSADGSCVEDFSGSVPSAAFGAGITALVLQANPDLTWRDIQHLIVETSNDIVIKEPYVTNAAGKKVSDLYGYGLVDAHAMTTRARTWPKVDPQRLCEIQATLTQDNSYGSTPFVFDQSTACTADKEMKFLEHVQVTLTLADVTDDVSLLVTSPSGTSVTVVTGTKAVEGTVMSVAFWGEEAKTGNWSVTFNSDKAITGELMRLTLTLRGTLTAPGTPQAGYTTLNVTENACPVLGPFQIQRSMTTDFTPLYIFIVLVLVILTALVVVTVYRRYLRQRIECRGCGPAFRQVPQNADSPEIIEA